MLKSTIARILILVVLVGVGVAIRYLFIPRVVLVASGEGTNPVQYTKSFATTRSWSVTYSFKCSSKDNGGGLFGFGVEYPLNVLTKADKFVFKEGYGGSSTIHYKNAGHHYIGVGSTCPWRIVVKDKTVF